MNQEHQLFQQFLRGEGLMLTPQRRAIFDAVFATHRHFDADELVEMLKNGREKISRATVYRTLDLLVKGGFIRAMELGESRKVYEHVIGHNHHDHLVCTACGRIIEFEDGDIETLQDKVCELLNFEPHTHSLRIFGKCERCRK